MLSAAQEQLDEKRFRGMQSGKLLQLLITSEYLQTLAQWMQTKLDHIHKKWEDIHHNVDLRQHDKALEKVAITTNSSNTESYSRPHLRIYSSGGILEKIMRRTYHDGLQKLKDNSFDSKEAKEEWQHFRDGLTPEELAVVTNKDWK